MYVLFINIIIIYIPKLCSIEESFENVTTATLDLLGKSFRINL